MFDEFQTQTTNLRNLNVADFLSGVLVPLAPLAEQKRIAATVEKVLARLNAARERLAKAPAILKRFRQAVLAAACSGRLTADWREDRNPPPAAEAPAIEQRNGGTPDPSADLNTDGFIGEVPNGWAWWTVEDISEAVIDYRGRTPPSSRAGTIPHIRTTNIRDGSIDWVADRFVTPEIYDKYMTRGTPAQGDVLFTMEGPLGEVGMVDRAERFSIAQRILLLRGRRNVVSGNYLALALRSPDVRRAIEARSTGSTVLGVAFKRFRFVVLPVPGRAEQAEIVRRVQAMFALGDKLENRILAATVRAGKIVQAVLAKAFRGELVPTEAELAEREGCEFETAEQLLARVRAARDAASSAPTPRQSRPRRRRRSPAARTGRSDLTVG